MNKDKFSKFVLPLFWIFSFLVIILLISFTSKASTSQKKLPYYVDFNAKQYFDVDIVDFHDQLVSCGFPNPTNENYICWLGDFHDYNAQAQTVGFDVYRIVLNNSDSNYGFWRFYGLYNSNDISTPLVNRIAPTNFDYQTNYVVFRSSVGTNYAGRVTRYTYKWDITNKQVISWIQNPNGYYDTKRVFLNGKNPANKNSYGFTSNVPIWYRYNDTVFTSGEYRVDYIGGYDIYQSFIIYCFGVPFGVPIPPNNNQDNIINPNSSAPSSPIINSYTPSVYNPPNFDNSSTSDALNSLFDIILYNGQYLLDNILGGLSNLTNNISNLIEYLKSSIDYGFQIVINNIKNGFQNIFDNIQNFFAPILEEIKDYLSELKSNLDYFIEPLNISAVETELQQTSFYNLISVGSSIKDTFTNYFDNIPQINTLSFTVPFSILTKSGFVTFDFNWYANIRDDVLPWIVGFLYAGFALALFRSIPSIIHGVSGVLQKGG